MANIFNLKSKSRRHLKEKKRKKMFSNILKSIKKKISLLFNSPFQSPVFKRPKSKVQEMSLKKKKEREC
jgi:hypothetical protein